MENRLAQGDAVHRIDGDRVLVLAPYISDEVFGCCGAIMRHVAAGNALHIVVVSDSQNFDGATQQVIASDERRAESCRAAQVMGSGEPEYWELPHHDIEYGERLVQRIGVAIVAYQADLVYVPSIYETDITRRILAMSTIEAVRRHGGKLKLAMYEVGVQMARTNILLDIGDLQARKQDAMACFASALPDGLRNLDVATINRFRSATLSGDIDAAEACFVVTADLIGEDALGLYEPEFLRQLNDGLQLAGRGQPKVSVLVRSMDRPLLQEALDSLALQTYPNIEVLVINARGKEHRPLGAWCGRFPLRVISTGAPLMRSRAANVGLDNATGAYLLFLDDDDWLAPNHVAGLVAALLDNGSCKVAYTGVGVRNFSREEMGIQPFNEDFNAGRLRGGNYIPIHAAMFASSLLDNGVRFDEAFAVYEDWDFFLQLLLVTPFAHVNTVSAFYRASGTSGVGVCADPKARNEGRAQIFEKWRGEWSGAQIDEMVQSVVNLEKVKQKQLSDTLLALDEAHAALNQAHAALSQTQAALSQTRASLEEKELRLNKLSRSVVELENQLAEKVGNIQVTDGRLYDMLHSTSWRVTAPIRWLGRAVLRIKRATKSATLRLLGSVLGKRTWPSGPPEVTWGVAGEPIEYPGMNNEFPLISVIMPVYNACRTDKRFFLHALESIANQTYKNLELIVVDDGSTDESRQVCEDFLARHPDLRAQYLCKENGGQSCARNFGAKACNGEYVGFLDQDDEWYENKLERVVPWLADKTIDVLYTDSDSIDGEGNVTFGSIHGKYHCGWPHPKKTIEDVLFKDVFIMPGLMTIKKVAFEQIGGFDEKLSGYEDDDLFLRLWEKFKVFYLPFPTLRWRMYGDNYSFSHRMLTSRTYFWKKLLKNYTNNGADRFHTHMISLRFFWQFMSQSKAQYQAGSELCWQSLSGAKEILPHLPWLPRAFFSFIFMFPDRVVLTLFVRGRGIINL